jgi:hypothetical protein
LARLGYHQYTAINNIFNMQMPFMPDDHVSGGVLTGSVEQVGQGPDNQEQEKKIETKTPQFREEGR